MPVFLSEAAGGVNYLESGWFSISVPNLIMISTMVGLFILALVLPFPKGHDEDTDGES